MLTFIEINGDMFADEPDILVCPTNCLGVMGAGLAKKFRMKFQSASKRYTNRCETSDITPGDLIIFHEEGKTLWFIPTKNDWRNGSEMEWIKKGIIHIRKEIAIVSLSKVLIKIHIPALGCGLGGLDWNEVKAIFESEFEPFADNPNIHIKIFAPQN